MPLKEYKELQMKEDSIHEDCNFLSRSRISCCGDCQWGRFGPAGVALCWMGSVLDHWQGSWLLHWFVELRMKPAAGGQMTMSGAAVGLGKLCSQYSFGGGLCDFQAMSTGTGQLWGGSLDLPGLVMVTDHVGEGSSSQALLMELVYWAVVTKAARVMLLEQILWVVVIKSARILLVEQILCN